VSDYAVGGGAATGFAGQSIGKSARAPMPRSAVAVERVVSAEDFKRLPVESLGDLVPHQGLSVQIGKLQVTSGLSEQAVRGVVRRG